MNSNKIVASMFHQKMKFPTPHHIGEVKGYQPTSKQCYVNVIMRRNQKETIFIQTYEDPITEKVIPALWKSGSR